MTAQSGTEFAAFISHASGDAEFADELRAHLEKRGLACWIAPRNVRPGAEYPEEISRGIQRSRCLVLVLSSAANESSNVRREVELAVRANKPVFPVRIEEVVPSPKLEFLISITQWIDAWQGQLAAHVQTLISAIEQGQDFVVPVLARSNRPRPRRWLKAAGLIAAVVLVPLVVALVAMREAVVDLGRVAEDTTQALARPDVQQSVTAVGAAIQDSVRQASELEGVLNRGRTDTGGATESAREYLRHPGLDAFVERAGAELATLRARAEHCRLPVNVSSVRSSVVVKAWPGAPQSALRPGDLILRVNGQSVDAESNALANTLARHRPGDVLAIDLDRNGSTASQSLACVSGAQIDEIKQQVLEHTVNRRWQDCIRANVMATVSFGEEASTLWHQAHCARYGGLIGQAQWNEQIYLYFVRLIGEAALGGLGDLEVVDRQMRDAQPTIRSALNEYSGQLSTVYRNAVASVRRQ